MKAEITWPDGPAEKDQVQFDYVATRDVLNQIRSLALPALVFLKGHQWLEINSYAPINSQLGRFILRTDKGRYFLKITTRASFLSEEKELTQALFRDGVPVSPLLDVGEIPVSDGGPALYFGLRPFYDGRHPFRNTDDFAHSLSSLTLCHRGLGHHPLAPVIKERTRKRLLRLEEMRLSIKAALKSGNYGLFGQVALWAQANHEWLEEVVGQADLGLCDRPDAQIVHGEPHRGNILMLRQDSEDRAMMLDFEESSLCYFPPSWDQAFLLQRFTGPETFSPMLKKLLQNGPYKRTEIFHGLQQIPLVTTLVLTDILVNRGIESPVQEWDKFRKLHSTAAALREQYA